VLQFAAKPLWWISGTKVTIHPWEDLNACFEAVGDIRPVDGVAVGDPAVEYFLEPVIMEPGTLRDLAEHVSGAHQSRSAQ